MSGSRWYNYYSGQFKRYCYFTKWGYNNFLNPQSITGQGDKERQYSQQSALIAKQKKKNIKINAEKALNPKIEEFKAYLEVVYKDTHPTAYYLVNPEKVFGFMSKK